jgi:hypothetical protein
MSWFRANRGGVAWLAFFALACQLLLSFGHVHLGTADGASLGWVAAAAAGNGGDSADAPASPPQKNAPAVPGDFCAICANIGLAGTLVVPDAPIVVAPSSFTQILPWSPAASEPARFDHFLFDARGPPQA